MFEVDLTKVTNIYAVVAIVFLLVGCFFLFGTWKDSSINAKQAM